MKVFYLLWKTTSFLDFNDTTPEKIKETILQN